MSAESHIGNDPISSSTSTPADPLAESIPPAASINHKAARRNARPGFEMKLVYRILRKISDWTLSNFFSEVLVKGKDNIEAEGALILTPCHHNEIIDIATLSATIPHRRIIAYWTKASLFKNPVSRFILSSAGSIPVERTPRRSPTSSASANDGAGGKTESAEQQALFRATYEDLARGGVLAVFPEGTSYTMPRIVQVKEGAAKAALGFIKWCRESGQSGSHDVGIRLVPVGIVYTDKSKYRSRLCVEYGEPIPLGPYIEEFIASDEGAREAARRLTAEIEREMVRLSVNSPDWETLYASQMVRDILWEDARELPLGKFVGVSQALIDLFASATGSPALVDLKIKLLHYHALLYRTGLTHTSLSFIQPPSSRSTPSPDSSLDFQQPVGPVAISLFLQSVLSIPCFFVALPAHISHLPGYVLGSLASRKFAGEEEEGRAQFKSIIGGTGIGIGTGIIGWLGLGISKRLASDGVFEKLIERLQLGVVVHRILDNVSSGNVIERCTSDMLSMATRTWARIGRLGDVVGVIGIAWILCLWHGKIIDSNYAKYRRLRATLMVLAGLVFSPSALLSHKELAPFLSTPPPPMNPFIAKALSGVSSESNMTGITGKGEMPSEVPTRKLVRHLLKARAEALYAIKLFFDEPGSDTKVEYFAPGDETMLEIRQGRSKGEAGGRLITLLRSYGAKPKILS